MPEKDENSSHRGATEAIPGTSDPQAGSLPGWERPKLDDRSVLNGILFVLAIGIPWEDFPPSLGFGSGMTGWRRLRDWQR